MAASYIAKGIGLVLSRLATAGTNPQSILSLFNGVGSGKIISVYRVWLENSQPSTPAASQGLITLSRTSARTASLTCTTAASTTVTCASPVSFFGGSATTYGASIGIGMAVSGTGVAAGAIVTAVASATSLTVSQTGSAGTNALTFASNMALIPVSYDSTNAALPAQIYCEHKAPVTYTGTSTTLSCTTAATTTLTTAASFYTSGVVVGSYVYGTNIATGTVVTAIASATSLTLSIAGLGAATNTLTFIAPDIIRRMPWSTKAPIVTTGTIDTTEMFSNWNMLWDCGYNDSNIEPLVLREGFGISIDNQTLTSTAPATAGQVDCFIEFTAT